MNTVVLYKSKSGFVKKYAEWIAEELSADIFDASKITSAIFEPYETVIYGGGLYAVGINGIKLITGNMDKLEGKKIIVFASGASPFREEVLEVVKNQNFNIEQQEKIKFFYLRGGFNFGKLKFIDKILMILLKIKLKLKARKKDLEPDEKGMLAAISRSIDFTNKKNIDGIITYLNP